jgi:hypothetical protein
MKLLITYLKHYFKVYNISEKISFFTTECTWRVNYKERPFWCCVVRYLLFTAGFVLNRVIHCGGKLSRILK